MVKWDNKILSKAIVVTGLLYLLMQPVLIMQIASIGVF